MAGKAADQFGELVIAKQTDFSTLATQAAADAKKYRRRSFVMNPQRTKQDSAIKNTHQQGAPGRKGILRLDGTYDHELVLGELEEPIAGSCRRAFTAGPTFTAGVGSEITTIAGPNAGATIVQRAGGDWIADGFRVGHAVMLGSSSDTENNDKPLSILALTATDMTVGGALTINGSPQTGVTVNVNGGVTFPPSSGHLIQHYTGEQRFTDIAESRLYKSMLFGGVSQNSQDEQLPQMSFPVIGAGLDPIDASSTPAYPYFTSPAEASDEPPLSPVGGTVFVDTTPIAILTQCNYDFVAPYTDEPTKGATEVDCFFPLQMSTSGSMRAHLINHDFLNMFLGDEIRAKLFFTYKKDVPGGSPEYFSVSMTNVSIDGNNLDDPDGPYHQDIPFVAERQVENTNGEFEQTQIIFQDSTLTP